MAAHITPLTETIEVGDEFEPWSPTSTGRKVRIIGKIYNPDMTISYRLEQIAGSGRMQNTVIGRKWLKNGYRRSYKTKRTVLIVKTREVFAGLEPVDGTA